MESTAQGRTEKTFSYVVRAPASDGFDVVNVDVKIDTCWVFQDVEESGEEQGCVPQGVASIPDVDAGQLREQRESSAEQKLLAAVDKYMMSESGLRSRVQELQLSERRLLQKVDQLSTRVAQERHTSLRAQEQLRVLKGELASRGVLDSAQGDSPSWSRVEAMEACGSQSHLSAACRVQASADRLSKGLCNSTGDGPCNTSGTTGELRGVAGSEHGQGESSQDGQVLLPRGCPQGQCMEERLFSLPLALSSQCPDACSAEDAEPRNGGEGVGLEENMAPDPGRVLPEASPDGDTAGWGSTKLGRSQIFSPWGAERTRDSFHQLLAVLRKERNQLLCDNARLQGDQEKYHREVCLLEKERVREAAETQRLEQMNCTLQGELGRIRQELHQCLQTLSALEDCNGRSYGRISELEEENERLKADLQQLQTALSESVRQDRGGMEHVAVENRELRALISEVGVSYKELIKDTVLSIGDMVQALQEENRHLLCRVQGLEQEVTLQINKDRESWGEGQHPQEDTKMAGDKGCTADKEVQVTTPLERLISTASGPPLDEEAGLVGGQREPSSDLDSRCRADATSLSLAQREAGIPQDLQEHTNAGGKASRLKPENKPQPRNFLEPAQALRSLSHGPQLQDGEARATEEDASLCVQRLRHQVRTLQCQLRDQGSALWQLQAARDKAVGLQDELKGKLEELREQQHEARLAMSPLKAKLASLVRKCQERNHLIMHLLWEMQRHGFGNLLLSRWAQNMLNDVALAEYAATFLGPGAPETSYKLDMGPEETAARGAQEYLVDSEVDNAMQSPLVASWPLPEVEGTAWATWLDSLKDRRQSGQAYATGKGECPSQVTNGTSGQ
uniref:uncharacterized protein C4orf50 homolog isoform X7 n=1 Tax=Jaculus jaculus TaxID=51337 RepID=UPI001E1B067B|nr:uncharacterized protein C4orf50 homolog isoform X7 [Jaculus jaculus]